MRVLAVLLPSAAAVRFALAIRGGQYFDWDEHRLERLRQDDAGGALDILTGTRPANAVSCARRTPRSA